MKVVIVAAFLMCGGSEFQTEGAKMKKSTTITFREFYPKNTTD